MALNKTLFRRIRNKILRVPEAYEQSDFGEEADTPCGTRACIAGHALLEAGFCTVPELIESVRIDPVTGRARYFSIPKEARKLLGLSQSQATALFAPSGFGWKTSYEKRFSKARGYKERARVAADYINNIIRTGKVD